MQGGVEVDRTETPFGIRTIKFDPNRGFFLNGKPVKTKGFCDHQQHAGLGVAIPDALWPWRLLKLKEELGGECHSNGAQSGGTRISRRLRPHGDDGHG